LGEHAVARLKNEKKIAAKIAGIRGKGVFLGIELKSPPEKFIEKGLEKGVILNLTSSKVIRVAPPINISMMDWNLGLDRLVETIAAL
jgi:acetylornithine/succinyldiaminopimelate/putrescine aminotransferase